MCRAGNTRVIGSDKHLQDMSDNILGPIQHERHYSFHIFLDIIVVLIGGDNAVGLG
jgi:hypothetical protein